jgi:hypothetical protein
VQKAIVDVVSQFSGVAVTDMAIGVDGCAVPAFGITVKAMALAYARLISPPASFDKKTRDACERIVRVMSANSGVDRWNIGPARHGAHARGAAPFSFEGGRGGSLHGRYKSRVKSGRRVWESQSRLKTGTTSARVQQS